MFLLNGELFDDAAKTISPFDRSFALGDGLFETVKVVAGRAVWLGEHLARLVASCAACGFHLAADAGEVAGWCAGLIAANNTVDGFLRITVSRGVSASGRFGDVPERASVAIIAGTSGAPNPPARAAFSEWRINESDPAVRHKSTSRFSHALAFAAARERGLDEMVFLNTKGYVAEGIYSNVFWVKDDELFTPSAECGLLKGIAREKILAAAKKLGVKTREGRFNVERLLEADEIFFTNSLWLLRPCGEFSGRGMSGKCIMEPIEKMLVASLFGTA